MAPLKPTVLHVLPTFDTGGLGSLALEMIAAWPEDVRHLAIAPKYAGTKPDLLVPFAKLCGDGNVSQVNRHVWMQPPVWVDLLAEGIAQLQRGVVPVNVIVYNFIDSVWSAQAARRAGFRGRIAAHVGTILPDTEQTRGTAQSKFAWATTFVPASQAVARALAAIGTPVERIGSVVWNGVDLGKYQRPPGPADIDLPRPLIFGFSGRMASPPVKDWEMLFKAFQIFTANHGDHRAELHIAGGGPLQLQLVKNTASMGLNITFTGTLSPEKMVGFLQGLDVFVMAALPFEGFSMALVEAVAAGCMILGTDVPSVTEVFSAGSGEEFLARNALGLAELMGLLSRRTTSRHANLSMVERLQPMLDSKRMAKAYWEIR